MSSPNQHAWRIIVVANHAGPPLGEQLMTDLIKAFPKVNWLAGTLLADSRSFEDSIKKAGAKAAFRLSSTNSSQTLQESLRTHLNAARNHFDSQAKTALVLESDGPIAGLQPSLYFTLLDAERASQLDAADLPGIGRANALVVTAAQQDSEETPAPIWLNLPAKVLQEHPSVLYRAGQGLPGPLESLVYQMLDDDPTARLA